MFLLFYSSQTHIPECGSYLYVSVVVVRGEDKNLVHFVRVVTYHELKVDWIQQDFLQNT